MEIFSMILSLLCGISLFLYGMSLMGDGLKSVAGDKLETHLYKMTNTPLKGVLLGTAVTSVIQSSSATTVMVIGFVNSGMMQLHQAIGIVMGANIGTSITGWVLCLSYIRGAGGVASLISSATIAAIAAIIGTLMKTLSKRSSHKYIANILLGFAILMVGMQMMSQAVSPLRSNPAFTGMMTAFSNPVLGILVGTLMTAVLQSASAAVGILQALAVTGMVTFSTAFPIILGIGVGAAAPVMFSAIGANKNGKRTALIYLIDDVFGMLIWAVGFYALNAAWHFGFLEMSVTPVIIAAVNTVYRLVTVIILFPFINQVEKLAIRLIPDSPEDLEDIEDNADFDLLEERLLMSPSLALAQSDRVIDGMARKVRKNVGRSLNLIFEYTGKRYEKVQRKEDLIDKYESKIGDYLVTLSKQEMNSVQTRKVSMNLRVVGDLERIGDYASAVAHHMHHCDENRIVFTDDMLRDLNIMVEAEREIVNNTIKAYREHDLEMSLQIKPLSAAITNLCEILNNRQIGRLSRGECDQQQAAVFNDLISAFERIGSHCVAIAGIIRRELQHNPEYHLHSQKASELTAEQYQAAYEGFLSKYDVISSVERPISMEAETEA